MSQRQALEAAGTFGNMLVPMGYARREAAGMSQRMVELGADLASFNDADPTETLDALRSGLAGETEPLRRFGIFLSDARLKQQALSMGLYDGKGALDAQAKSAATYALILKDSSDAQGDFARTSDSLANQQRTLKGQYENLTATLGQKVLPMLSFLVKNIDSVVIAVGALTAAWAAYKIAALAATIQTQGLTLAMLANPVGLVIAGLIALGGALVIAYRKVEWFRNGVDATWSALKAAAIATTRWIVNAWRNVVSFFANAPKAISRAVAGMFDGLKEAFRSAINWIIEGWNSLDFKVPSIDLPGPLGKVGGFTLGMPDVPLLGSGGIVVRSGAAVVGDRGPELVNLPQGAAVSPLPTLTVGGLGIVKRIEVPVYLNRRQIAQAVAEDTADQKARR
jgi:hypothetical protein